MERKTEILGPGSVEFDMLNVRFKLNTVLTCLGAEATDLAERIALAFSAAVLYVLCEPRYDPPGIPDKFSKVKSLGHDCIILICAGHDCVTASNSWLFWHHHGHDMLLLHTGSAPGHTAMGDAPFCPWDPDGSCACTPPVGISAGCGGCGGVCTARVRGDRSALCGDGGWFSSGCADGGGISGGDGGGGGGDGCGCGGGDGGGCGGGDGGACGSGCGGACGGGG